eukprot:364488-Chlamydomonas_euryale.AAC.3
MEWKCRIERMDKRVAGLWVEWSGRVGLNAWMGVVDAVGCAHRHVCVVTDSVEGRGKWQIGRGSSKAVWPSRRCAVASTGRCHASGQRPPGCQVSLGPATLPHDAHASAQRAGPPGLLRPPPSSPYCMHVPETDARPAAAAVSLLLPRQLLPLLLQMVLERKKAAGAAARNERRQAECFRSSRCSRSGGGGTGGGNISSGRACRHAGGRRRWHPDHPQWGTQGNCRRCFRLRRVRRAVDCARRARRSAIVVRRSLPGPLTCFSIRRRSMIPFCSGIALYIESASLLYVARGTTAARLICCKAPPRARVLQHPGWCWRCWWCCCGAAAARPAAPFTCIPKLISRRRLHGDG